ncbi:MAG: hypothetical protein WA118_03545 [Carboxydocellales bacterium]
MDTKYLTQISELYQEYRSIIKPLIAEVESAYEEFPLPLLNEIRAFNDHISRCFQSDVNDDEISTQLKKAKSHNVRIIFDCYKFLNVYYYDKIKKFEKQIKNINLTTINSGQFYIKYRELRQKAINKVREAKKEEVKGDEGSFNCYQDAYNCFVELDDYISDNLTNVNWARAKFYTRKFVMVFSWLLSIIIASVLSNNNVEIISAFKSIFK